MTTDNREWVRVEDDAHPRWELPGLGREARLVTDATIRTYGRRHIESTLAGYPPLPEEAWKADDHQPPLTPDEATAQAIEQLHQAGFGTPMPGGPNGSVRVDSKPAVLHRVCGDAMLTTVTAAGPCTDVGLAAVAVGRLPGVLQVSQLNHRQAVVYRSRWDRAGA